MPFNFFEAMELPVLDLDESQARAMLDERYDVSGQLWELGSQQDVNYRVRSDAGETYVLKVSNPAFSAAELSLQHEAIERLATVDPTLRLPRPYPGRDGEDIQRVRVGDRDLDVRLLDYVAGEPIMDSSYLAPPVVARLGEISARVAVGLRGFDHRAADRVLQWDVRNASAVVDALAPYVRPDDRRERVIRATRTAHDLVAPYADRLPMQVIHGDITDNNIVCEVDAAGRRMPVGVIDFGDVMRSWTVAELAVTCTSVIHHHGASPASIIPAVRAFHATCPLSTDEIDVLWPLVILRAAVLVVSGHHGTALDSRNDYAAAALDREWEMFETSTSVPVEVMTAELRAALGLPAAPDIPAPECPLTPDLDVSVKDLSVRSGALHAGRWLEPAIESQLLAGATMSRYGEYRLTRAVVDQPGPTPTMALGVEVKLPAPVDIRAPWRGTLAVHDDSTVTLSTEGVALVLRGLDVRASRGTIGAGELIGVAGGFRVQLSRLGDALPPEFVVPELSAGWLAVCPDPSALLGAAAAATDPDPAHLLDRRNDVFATVQEHYFATPPQIERGWRHHLIDTQGRTYVDMLNNVSILGHGHPALSDAIHEQWQRLNTNSRFHFASVVEFSERLAALLPDELDTVFLVNSGSEANDLALRLAWAVTGRRDVVAVGEAYHGWTDATDAISTSVADNPDALSTRPDWVHAVPAPNAFRGVHRGRSAHRYGIEAVAMVAELSRPPAAFICEPYYGNAGGMPLPDGYLEQVYAATRARGGLCIADEVQVGYGRLGSYFWGFDQQGVVPDVVTIAKAMGNGHPLGAVVTSREIAEGYRSHGYFFSSAGGSPVSSVVGLIVLDVLETEGLQENARLVGAHLRSRLLELAERHPLIGAVHGSGLYLGVEFVRDRETLEPATEETAAICERLRELGVIMQPTSDRLCVLKIKPPLCLTRRSADLFVDALDDALTNGW